MMRRNLTVCLLAFLMGFAPVWAQDRQWTYVDAATLTFVGKLFPDTPNPYHRLDTEVYGGFSESELRQVHQSSGMAIAFRTDSEGIAVKPEYGQVQGGGNTAPNAKQGFDLYIKKDGKWVWAGAYAGGKSGVAKPILIFNKGGRMCDCLIYLPVFAELTSLEIGVYDDSRIEPLEGAFRHRIGVFGSSFTQGYGVSRPGMGWTSQLSRMTGIS